VILSERHEQVRAAAEKAFRALRAARRRYIAEALEHPERERVLQGAVESARLAVEYAIEEARVIGTWDSRETAFRHLHAKSRAEDDTEATS
jgi:hypothetical protein